MLESLGIQLQDLYFLKPLQVYIDDHPGLGTFAL